jgi:hypothetical protein
MRQQRGHSKHSKYVTVIAPSRRTRKVSRDTAVLAPPKLSAGAVATPEEGIVAGHLPL